MGYPVHSQITVYPDRITVGGVKRPSKKSECCIAGNMVARSGRVGSGSSGAAATFIHTYTAGSMYKRKVTIKDIAVNTVISTNIRRRIPDNGVAGNGVVPKAAVIAVIKDAEGSSECT